MNNVCTCNQYKLDESSCKYCKDKYMDYDKIKTNTMTFDKILDSGKREKFDTGSVRDTEEGKGDYSLISFYALHRLALHYQKGAAKYDRDNWRKGQSYSRYVSSAMRHIIKWSLGYTDEDHLAAAAFNIFGLIETERMVNEGRLPKELDNRWDKFDGLDL